MDSNRSLQTAKENYDLALVKLSPMNQQVHLTVMISFSRISCSQFYQTATAQVVGKVYRSSLKKKKERKGIIFNLSVMNIKRGHKCNRNPHPNAKKENSNVANDACMNVLCGIL